MLNLLIKNVIEFSFFKTVESADTENAYRMKIIEVHTHPENKKTKYRIEGKFQGRTIKIHIKKVMKAVY